MGSGNGAPHTGSCDALLPHNKSIGAFQGSRLLLPLLGFVILLGAIAMVSVSGVLGVSRGAGC
jgi:hypothetical protein